jgi:uncharacterized membrane protein YidH (DUF202 family)
MDEQLQKAFRKVKLAENLRMLLLFLCLLIVLFLFYGDKFWGEAEWFQSTKLPLYNVLFFVVIIMFVLSVVRIFLVKSYNSLVKKSKKS